MLSNISSLILICIVRGDGLNEEQVGLGTGWLKKRHELSSVDLGTGGFRDGLT